MELAAVGRDEFVQGFKLAGVRKTFSVARDAVEAQVAKVLEDPNVGILIRSADDMTSLSNTMRRRLETTPVPWSSRSENAKRKTSGRRSNAQSGSTFTSDSIREGAETSMAVKGKEKAAAAGKTPGEIFRVAGPVVTATGLRPRMYDVQFVGEEQLLGEVIQVVGDKTIIQVYEDTCGVRPGGVVLDTGGPLVVELGPGLLGSIYDGIQRPLPVLQKVMGDFVLRGVKSPGLTREKSWAFAPKVQPGQAVGPGEVVGTVQEAKFVEHRIMAPPTASGTVKDVKAGE